MASRGLLAAALVLALPFLEGRAIASSDTWRQSDWSGGVVLGSATYPADVTTWTGYDSKAATVTYVGGTGLQLLSLKFPWTTTDNSATATGFNYTGATWTRGISISTFAAFGSTLTLSIADTSAQDGGFDTNTYAAGIPGITKNSATSFSIDTDNASRNGTYRFIDFRVRSGVTLTVTGSNKLIMNSTGTVQIDGALVGNGGNGAAGGSCASAYLTAGGPGGGRGAGAYLNGEGTGGSLSAATAGTYGASGGAGFGGAGGTGAGATINTAGGSAYCNSTLDTFSAGSGAGGAGHTNCCIASGGGGGGAIYIQAKTVSVTATGSIQFNGGTGSSYPGCSYSGSGGGSGGAILVEALLSFSNAGVLQANGGNGGGTSPYWGGGGGGGIIRVNSPSYSNTGTITAAGGAASGGAAAPGQSGLVTTGGLSSLSGMYTSGVFDTGGSFDFFDVSWSSFIPVSGGNIVVDVRAGNTASPDGSWTAWAPFTNGQSLGGSMDYLRYVQWRSSFTAVAPSTAPALYDLSVTYVGYDQLTRALTSNVFDTGSSSNAVLGLAWTQTASAPAMSRMRLRTSPDAQTWTAWVGPNGTSGTIYTDPLGGEGIPYLLRDGVGDRYIQYRVYLNGSGSATPTVSVTSVTFGTAATPLLTELTPDSSTQITLSFDDNSDDEDDFRVSTGTLTGPINDVGSIPSADKAGTGPQAGPMSALIPNTLYYVRLRSHVNAGGGYSSFSNELSTPTRAAVPAASTTPYLATAATLRIYWEANNNPSGTAYYPEMATDAGFTTGLVDPGWSTQYSQIFGGLSLGTTYYFRVKARNQYQHETAWRDLHAAQAVANASPLPISFVGSSSATVNWGLNGNPAYSLYNVQRTGSGGTLWYSFEDNWLDSDGSNAATPVVAPTFTAGKVGRAAAFNGTNQYAQSSQNVNITGAAPRTLSFWFYPTAAGNKDLISWGAAVGNQVNGLLFDTNRKLYFWNGVNDFACNTAVSLNAWHHVALTYDGTTVRVYLDGVLDGSTPGLVTLATTNTVLYIGVVRAWGYFAGYFDEIGLASRALSAAEVAAMALDVTPFYPDSSWAAGTTKDLTGLTSNVKYGFWVKSANPSLDPGASWVSLGSTVTLVSSPATGSAPSVSNDNRIRVDWGANGNPAGTMYTLQRSTNADFSAPVVTVTTTSLTNDDLWTTMAPPGYNAYNDACMTSQVGDFIYAFPAGGQNLFLRYSVTANTWQTLAAPGYAVTYGAMVYAGGDYIYAFVGGNTNILLRYSISANSWTTMAAPGYAIDTGSDLTWDGGDSLYAFVGNWSQALLRYSISANSWTTLANCTWGVYLGGSLASDGGNYIYAFPGGNQNAFGRYSISANTWATMTAPGYNIYFGGALSYAGGDYLYAFPGNSSNVLLRYSITGNNWTTQAAPGYTIDYGGSFGVGGDYAYAFPGGSRNIFQKYKLPDAVPPQQTYYFRVGAQNSAGSITPFTGLGSGTAKPNWPLPAGLAYTNITGTQIQVNWTSGTAAGYNPAGTEYYFEVSPAGDFSSGVSNSGWLADTYSYAFTGLSISTRYYFRGRSRQGGVPANESPIKRFPSFSTTPNLPGALPHVSVSSVQVYAAWTANGNPGGTQYLAEAATDAGFTANLVNSGWTTNTSGGTPVIGLIPNTVYHFRVKAKNPAGIESSPTALSDQRTNAAIPNTVAVSNVLGTSIRLTWGANNNPGGTEYWSEIGTSSWPAWVPYSTAGWTTSSQVDFSGLTPNTTYHFRVKARTTEAVPVATAFSVVASTLTRIPPAAPSGLGVDLTGIGVGVTDRLRVFWTDNSSDEDGFKLERSTDGVSFALATSLAINAVQYTDNNGGSGLIAATSYYYRLRSYNIAGGDSLYSNTAALYTRAATPGAFKFILVDASSLTVSWNAAGNGSTGTVYTAEISSMSGFTPLTASSSTVGFVSTFTATGLLANTTYYGQVVTRNGNGLASAYAASVTTITVAAVPVAPVFSLVWYSSLTVSWQANANPGYTRYLAQISTASDYTGTLLSSTTRNTSAPFTGLIPDTYYYFRVQALNEWNKATAFVSPAASTITYAEAPTVSALSYSVYATSVTVRWATGNNPAVTRYRIQRSPIGDPTFSPVDGDSFWNPGNSFTFSGLVQNSTYYFRAKARNQANTESPADTNWVILPSTQTQVEAPLFSPPDVFITSIAAHWLNTNPPGTPYQAELSDQANFSVLLASSDWQNDLTSYDFTGLFPNSKYYVRVRARNTAGIESANATLYGEYTRALELGDPISPYNRTGSAITINWNRGINPDPDTLYEAVLASTADFSAGTATSPWVTDNAYAFGGLSAGTTYYFRVHARNKNALPFYTAWKILPSTVTMEAPTPAPSGLSLVFADASAPDRLRLNWTDNPTTEFGYRIYESTDGVSYSLKDTQPPNVGTYLSVGLSSNTVYSYKVSAFNTYAESFSNVASTCTRAAAPAAGGLSSVLTNSLRASWDSAGNPAGTVYAVEASTKPDFSALASSQATTAAYYDFTGLEANATFYVQVKAFNSFGQPTSYVSLGSTLTLSLAMRFDLSDMAPASLIQGQRAAFLKIVAKPNGAGSRWTSLSLARTGTGHDLNVGRVSVRRDGNGNGLFEVGNDPEAGWGVFTSSALAVALNENLSGPATYFVVMTAADNYLSWPGDTFGSSVAAVASFVSPTSGVSMYPATLASGLAAITKLADTIDVAALSVAPSPTISRGVSNIPMLKLSFLAQRDRAYLRSIDVQKTGTLADGYLALKVYRDSNYNGTMDGGDELASSGVDLLTGGAATLQLLNPSTRTVVNDVYFLTFDVDPSAPLGATVGLRVPNSAGFTLMAGTPDSVILSPIPGDSAVSMVSDPPNILQVTPTDMGVVGIPQGSRAALTKLQLVTDSGNAVVTQIKVQRSTASVDSDYAMAALYRDNPAYDSFGISDALVASGTFSSGQVTFGLTETVTNTSTKTYFVVIDVSPSATPGDEAGTIIQSGYIKAASAATAISAPYPIASPLALITPTVDKLIVTPDGSVAPSVANQSASAVPVLALKMETDANAASLSALIFNEVGSAQDSDIAAIRVYRDDGNSVFNPYADALVSGNYSFSGGSATVSFSSLETVTVSSSVYYVAVDIAPAAVPGRTLQLRLSGPDSFAILAPDVISTTYPVTSNAISLQKLTATVRISTQSLAPSAVLAGTEGISMEKFSLGTNVSTAKVNSVTILRSGGLDVSVSSVTLYWDANGNGPEPNEVISSGPFSGGTIVFPFPGASGNLTTVPKDFYLSMGLSAAATIGSQIGLNVISFNISAPDVAEGGRLPFASGQVNVDEPPSEMGVAWSSQLPATVTQGNSGVLIASVTMRPSSYSATLRGIDLLRAGAGVDADIASLKLYQDDGNGTWGGAAEETLLTTAAFSAGAASFGFPAQTLSYPQSRTYFLVADISYSATPGATFGVSLPAASYLRVDAPDTTSPFTFASTVSTIAATVDTLVATTSDLAPAVRQSDSLKALGSLVLRADANTVTLTSLRLDKTGTALDADVSGLRIYLDDGNGVFDPALDTLVAQAPGLSNGSVGLLLSPSQEVTVAAQKYFVAADVALLAQVGSTLGLTISSGSFSVNSPDIVSLTPAVATFSIAGTIADAADTVRVALTDLTSSSLYKGINDNLMAKVSLRTDSDQAVFTGLKVNLNGTASVADLSTLKLYRDADGDGAFDPALDVVAAAASFSGSQVTLTLGSPLTLTSTPRDFFLTLDIPSGAVIENTVGLSLANQSSVLLSGIDVVEAFSGLATSVGTIRDPRVPRPPTVKIRRVDDVLSAEDPTYNGYETRVTFEWDSSVYQGSVEYAQYVLGTAPGVSTSAWTPVGTQRQVVQSGLDLSNGVTYYLSVRAKNVLGNYYSDIVSRRIVIDSFKPTLPGAASATTEGATVRIAWPAAAVGVSGLAYYKIEQRTGSSPVWLVVSTTTERSFSVNYTGAGVLSSIDRPAGTYFYRVTAVNGAGLPGEPSAVVVAQLGLATLPNVSSVSSYPNPFDSRSGRATINMVLKTAADIRIDIYGVFGGKVRALSAPGAAGSNDVFWDGTDEGGRKVAKGMYLAVITVNGTTVKHKIGVIH